MSNINVNNITPESGDKVSISGSLHASGDITANGNITLGNSSSDSVYFGAEVSSSIIPDATNTYDLGSPSKVWREIYVSSESLNFVDGAGSSSKFTKENVDDLKSGKSSATIGGFATSTRTKAIFQDDDTSTYKKMTQPGRVSQFISGAMVKDYNKSGSNSYTTYDNIDSISWMNFSSMSMDVNAGGFFGVGVSGSTYASNLAQFYIDFVQSGSTTFEGGNVDVEVEDSGSSFTISGSEGTTLNVSGGITTFEVSDSGSGVEISGSDGTTLNVSGGITTFEVSDSGSGVEISGSDGTTLNVSGGNVVFDSDNMAITGTIFLTGSFGSDVSNSSSSFDISGSEGTTLNVSGGITTFVVSNTESLVQITGSEGTSLNVSGGNVVITSEFTQSGTSIFEDGTSTFSGNTSTTSSILSGSDIAISVSGTLEADNVVLNQSNMVPITSSQTLTYTGPKPYYVRSGSGATFPSGPQQGLPIGSSTYTAYTPFENPGPAAGELTLTLPTAQVGMQFTIKNLHNYYLRELTAGQATAVNVPSLKIKPQATDGFYTGATGSFGIANGKGIINHSGSAQEGDEAMIWSPSGSKWMIGSLVGTWIDEA